MSILSSRDDDVTDDSFIGEYGLNGMSYKGSITPAGMLVLLMAAIATGMLITFGLLLKSHLGLKKEIAAAKGGAGAATSERQT